MKIISDNLQQKLLHCGFELLVPEEHYYALDDKNQYTA